METTHFQNIRRIFEAALEQDASAREQFVQASCNGDKDLQREVSRLLSAHDSADSWFDKEVVESIIRPNSVAFKPGTKIGTYEILELLGVGGMGEVYRARDTTLHSRQVAIKVLPETFSRDPERVSRFEREALVLASLNHAHIGAIYHVVESNASSFLVLELVEGETLAARIAQGPIPLTEALAYAKQITEALEYAHERGIVHRDLKPANIKVTPDDQIKVLDFGLAKVRDNPWINSKDSPTLSETAPARILGTAAYMSPEQASGKEADGRSDIWALGCLLHEMLTGRALFTGESVSEILAEVLKGEPDFSRLPASTPQSIRRLLRRCLQKDRKRRIRHIADARMEIDEAFSEPESGLPIGSSRITRREALAWISVGGLAIANVATAIWMNQTRNDEISIDPHDGTRFTGPDTATIPVPQFAISPDGQTIVFAAAKSKDQPKLWVRRIYEAEALPLPRTDGAESPFWSPDSEWIGFFAEKKLKKTPASGGHVTEITGDGVSDPRGGSWGTDGTILFASGMSQIYSVNASGGSRTEITTLNRKEKEGSHRWPHFLPDGKHFLYTVRSGSKSQRGIWVGNVKDRTIKLPIAEYDSNALYSRSGHILFLDRDQLLARPFDLKTLSVSGQLTVIATGVGRSTLGNGAVSVSNFGRSLAYAGPMRQTGKLQEFDRNNAPKGAPLDDEQNEYEYTDFRLSPDERWLAVTRSDHEKGWVDIWLKDLKRNSSWERLQESDNTINASPVWLSDSSHVVFRSNPSGVIELYRKQVPRGPMEVLLSEDDMHRDPRQLEFTSLALTDCAPDDSRILFSAPTVDGYDLWEMPITENARAKSFLPWPGNQIHGNFSPNGKFIAYASREELGRYEVYVVDSSRHENTRQRVSTGLKQAEGGSEPRWRSDGKELYYLSEDRSLVAVPFENGMPGTPRVLFRTGAPASINALRMNYVPKRDGQSFLVNTLANDQTDPFITVLTNWTSLL